MSSISIKRILVAIKDPTLPTPPSVVKAGQLARAWNAELVLFHGIDVPLYAEAYNSGQREIDDEDNIRKHFLHNLNAQAAPVKQDGHSISVAAEWDYPAHKAVLRYAQRIQADLIVAERHPHASATPWALHSADWELLRLSSKPVLIVKDPRRYQKPVVVAALDPLHRHAKASDLDAEICTLAGALSSALDGAWHVLHALHPSAGGGLVYPKSTAPGQAVDPQRAKARAAVDQLLQSLSIQPQSVQLQDLSPAEAILESSRDLHAAIVVMGAISRSGLKRLLIGNTAERVIEHLSCDVLVVKPKRFGTHFSRQVRGAHMLPSLSTAPFG